MLKGKTVVLGVTGGRIQNCKSCKYACKASL